ncbi:hypothetical protein QL285_046438 [Trifolium repens]|jgi:hypothetical protein|nr:hypothetical protein QL285_046438 [Trifolium repens]
MAQTVISKAVKQGKQIRVRFSSKTPLFSPPLEDDPDNFWHKYLPINKPSEVNFRDPNFIRAIYSFVKVVTILVELFITIRIS